MRILTVAPDHYADHQNDLAQMHRLRAIVFRGRLEWDVTLTESGEFDEYDKFDPTYILAITDDARVVGCARLLPTQGPTCWREPFPAPWNRLTRRLADLRIGRQRTSNRNYVANFPWLSEALHRPAGAVEDPLEAEALWPSPTDRLSARHLGYPTPEHPERCVTQLRSHPRLVRKLQDALGDQLCA